VSCVATGASRDELEIRPHETERNERAFYLAAITEDQSSTQWIGLQISGYIDLHGYCLEVTGTALVEGYIFPSGLE